MNGPADTLVSSGLLTPLFGPAPKGINYKEDDRYRSGNPYAASKAGGEEMCISFFNTYKLPILITHTMNVIGERQHPEKFFPKVINHVLKNKTLTIHSNKKKTIGEVAQILNLINKKNGNLNTHTIRFWEKEFKQIRPKKLSGNRRYYDNASIEILKNVKYLLKDQGMTIKGVKKLLDNGQSLKLDELSKNSISDANLNIKDKLKKILRLVKDIKKLK